MQQVQTSRDGRDYGFCYFFCKFLWQPSRVLGFLGALGSLLVFLLGFKLDAHLLLTISLITLIPFILLSLYNYLYKVRILGLTMNDCVWPGLHLGMFTAMFYTAMAMCFWRCADPGALPNDETSRLEDIVAKVGATYDPSASMIDNYLTSPFIDFTYSCTIDHDKAGYYVMIATGLAYLIAVLNHHDIKGALGQPQIGFAEAGEELERACKEKPKVCIQGEAVRRAMRMRAERRAASAR